ncbi:MAG: hypothetical protein V3S10_01790 [Dehalococcoidales bacterium]
MSSRRESVRGTLGRLTTAIAEAAPPIESGVARRRLDADVTNQHEEEPSEPS